VQTVSGLYPLQKSHFDEIKIPVRNGEFVFKEVKSPKLLPVHRNLNYVILEERSLRPKGLRRFAAGFFASLRMTRWKVDGSLN
jgi:hypothetical protein